MCAICGWVLKDGDDVDRLAQMNRAAAHRGPDGAGYWTWNLDQMRGRFVAGEALRSNGRPPVQVGLGHRRLSILDLSEAGAQPMASADGGVWLTFNGEIYNYVELRDELRALGHTFRTSTDTEVILAAYEEWGPSCFQRFNGMWGLAIADIRRRELVISRDRLGIKPLYLANTEQGVLFASEIKQILASGRIRAVANMDAVVDYVETGYEAPPATMFAGIQAFPPGCWAHTSLDHPGVLSPQSYWHPTLKPAGRITLAEAVERTREIFSDAVRLQLRSDVPVGVCLSGGIDSSAIFGQACALGRERGFTPRAFSAAFDDPRFDERPFIEAVLAASGGSTSYAFPTAEAFVQECDRVIYHHDEPPGSLSQYAAWSVMSLARRSSTPVLLSGQGGDELFSGYWPAYYLFLRQRPASAFGHLAGALLPGGNPHLVFELVPHLRQYLHRRARRNKGLLVSQRKGAATSGRALWAQRAQHLAPEEYRLAEIRDVHLPRLLKWDDRNSMAFGVEGRYPFLDHRLVEWALTLPPALNLNRGWNKVVLRRSLGHLMPRSVQWRRSKVGFVTPQSDWIRTALRPVLRAWAREPSDSLTRIVNHRPLKELVDGLGHSRNIGRMDERHTALMRLFMLDRWIQRFDVAV